MHIQCNTIQQAIIEGLLRFEFWNQIAWVQITGLLLSSVTFDKLLNLIVFQFSTYKMEKMVIPT